MAVSFDFIFCLDAKRIQSYTRVMSNFTHVSKTATCKRCGSTTVTWQRGKQGKWFLTEVFTYGRVDGVEPAEMTSYTDFHSAYCNKPEVHAVKQAEIILQDKRDKDAADERDDQREQERITDEAAKLALWYQMEPGAQKAHIEKLEREIKRTLDGITMDYFKEYCDATAHAAALRSEIEMYLLDSEDEDV